MTNNFKKHLTFKNFKTAFLEKELEPLRKEIITALNELALNGFLQPIQYSEVHETNFSYSWNNLINQTIKNSDNKHFIENDLNYFIDSLIIYNSGAPHKDLDKVTEEQITESFNKFIEYLEQGDFDTYCTPEGECFNCGARLKLKFKNWVPTFFEYKEILDPEKYLKKVDENSPLSFLNKSDYFPADTCFTDLVQIKEFDFKTGNLIISDWIKIEEFTNTVEVNENIYHFDINNAKGRFEAFEHYFKQNFISIHSYSGLDIYSLTDEEMKDAFVFGKVDYKKNDMGVLNNPNYKQEETVNHGLRATTIIEKETLIDIINKSVNDLTKATQIVNNYLKNNKREIITKKITPGTYNLIFDLKRKDVSELLFPIDIPDELQASIFMYPKNLFPSLKEEKNNQPNKMKI